MNPTIIHEDMGSIPGYEFKDLAVSCGVGCRHVQDLAMLWLCWWLRPVAAPPMGLLAWELPYAAGVALKRRRKKNLVDNSDI